MTDLFVRKSSGLTKEVGLLDATMLNVANMGAGLALFTGVSSQVVPGVFLWEASLLTFLLTLPLLFAYSYLLMNMPRAGGDYVWVSRLVNKRLGPVLGVAFALNMPPFFALSAFFTVQAMNYALQVMGTVDRDSTLTSLASSVFVNPGGILTPSQEVYVYLMAALAFALVVAVNIAKPRWGVLLTSVLGVYSVLATVLATGVVAYNLPHFRQDVMPLINSFSLSPGNAGPVSLGPTLYMVPYFASFAYIWLYAGPAVGSELRGNRAVKYNLLLGSLLTALLITLPFLIMDLGGGAGFNDYLYTQGGAYAGVYNFWDVALVMAKSPYLQWFIASGLVSWEYFVMSFGVVVFARYVFAFSFDRLFPSIFSRLNSRGSPAYAHLLDLGLTLFFLTFPILLPQGYTALYSYTPLAVVYLVFVSLASALLARRKGERGKMLISLLSLLGLGVLGYEAFTNSYFGVWNGDSPNWSGVGYILGLIGTGAVVYLVSRAVRSRQGISLEAVYSEVPPE